MTKRSDSEQWAERMIAAQPPRPPEDFSVTTGGTPQPTPKGATTVYEAQRPALTHMPAFDPAESDNSGGFWWAPYDERARNFWKHHGHVDRSIDRVTGKEIAAKRPAVAHTVADGYEARKRHELGTSARSIELVNASGNIVHVVLSNGAPHIPAPNDPWRMFQLNSARAGGWYPAFGCVLRWVREGWMERELLVAEELRSAKLCAADAWKDRLCPHGLTERAARLEIHAKRQAVIQRELSGQIREEEIANRIADVVESRTKGKK